MRFMGLVTSQSVVHLVKEIRELQREYFYRTVELEIDSEGGEVASLYYFVSELEQWKRDGLRLTTRALTQCASAAAAMLSLGDEREASATSRLLFHHARVVVPQAEVITKSSAEDLAYKLWLEDERIAELVVERILEAKAGTRDERLRLTDVDGAILAGVRSRMGELGGDLEGEAWLKRWLDATDREERDEIQKNRWLSLYRSLCDVNRPISAELARKLRLIDRIRGERKEERRQKESVPKGLYVPEWEGVLNRSGIIEKNSLRRHTLVLGESGSGKTSSAVLPLVSATCQSDDIGVGLIIDPKGDVSPVLEAYRDGSVKRIERIENHRVMVDLMTGKEWSIKRLLQKEKYWSAARRILMRISGLSQGNPARVLLGEPVPDREPFWAHQGTTFATAILAVAIHMTLLSRKRGGISSLKLEAGNGTDEKGLDEVCTILLDFARAHQAAQSEEGVERGTDARGVPEEAARVLKELSTATGLTDEAELKEMCQIVHWIVDEDWINYDPHAGDVYEGNNILDDDAYCEKVLSSLKEGVEAPWVECDKDFNEMREISPHLFEVLEETKVKRFVEASRGFQAARAAREEALARLSQFVETKALRLYERFKREVVGYWNESAKDQSDFRSMLALTSSLWSVPAETNVISIADLVFNELGGLAEQKGSSQGLCEQEGESRLHALGKFYRSRSGGEWRTLGNALVRFADMRAGAEMTYVGVWAQASTIWMDFADPGCQYTVYFGCEGPILNPKARGERRMLSFVTDVENRDSARAVLYYYQPSLRGVDNLFAKILKTLYFEAITDSEERRLHGQSMPLAAYIADEFQRYITADKVHGEQSFFDICRSFGAFAVVASQSIAGLRFALCNLETDGEKRQSAIDIIFNNTATKLFFRSTDADTAARLDVICPAMDQDRKVTRSRPLATLATGECYCALPDGRFMRVQMKPHVLPSVPLSEELGARIGHARI